MTEEKKNKHQYYLDNKDKWRKGGKYYYYKPKSERYDYVKLEVKTGKFVLRFD